jgi:ketosteroid isomerase-like protein
MWALMSAYRRLGAVALCLAFGVVVVDVVVGDDPFPPALRIALSLAAAALALFWGAPRFLDGSKWLLDARDDVSPDGFQPILDVQSQPTPAAADAADAESVTRCAFAAFAQAQGTMYAGADGGMVREMLTADVIWHVPGTSAIAGEHRGRDAVMTYFLRRRELARGAMQIVAGEQLVRGDTVIQFADGNLELDGERLDWRTAGVYRFEGERVAEAWLVPLELDAFDAVWTSLGEPPD